jgi:hypothetical protein
MKFIKNTIAAIILVSFLNVNAQNTIIDSEIGILVGPVFMQTDYLTSASSEVGIDFGVAYIADFSPSRYKSKALTWIANHMKTRVELSFSKVKLQHDINELEGSELKISQFEGMRGDVKILNFGVFGEWNFLSLTKTASKVRPYFLTGISYTSADSSVSFDSNVGLPSVYTAQDRLFLDKNNAVSFTNGLGLRFKLLDVDLVAEGRFQSFLSDRIDGIDTDISDDKSNDAQVLFKIGAIFHLN